MEMEKGSASTSGTVTMEISIAATSSVEQVQPEESVQHYGQHPAGAAIPQRNYRMLIVIGEISSSHHLDVARKQITQGKQTEDRVMRGTSGQSEVLYLGVSLKTLQLKTS